MEVGMRRQVGAAVLAALFGMSITAEVDTGTLSGVVRDTSSAGVPRAKMILRNEDTGITLEVATNEAGIYVSPPLRSGVYVVEVEAQGFERAARRVQLDVSQRAAVDFE